MRNPRNRRTDDGSLLVILPMTLVVAVGLVIATLTLSAENMTEANRETRRVQAYYVAKAGIERQIWDLEQMTKVAVLVNPFAGVDQLHKQRTYDGEVLDVGSEPVGTYDVSVRIEGIPLDGSPAPPLSNSKRFVTVRATGFVPNEDDPNAVSHTIETTVLVELSASEVFDYAYFINNWGWFYGDTITANGNVRSNGQFDVGNHTPAVNGAPRYLGVNGTDLYGYIDDNADGVTDGSDGGIYAGWDIVGAQLVQGMAGIQDPATGEYINQHDFAGQVEMPNLTDFSLYEQHAVATNSSISIGGSQICDAVYGDDPGESGHLVLIGTQANPIELNGTVVVRGSLIIKGYVKGQGVIYSGENVYIADDIKYVTPPATERPASNSEADIESWLQQNQAADALGLFAREHIVLGDQTDSTYQFYVNWWMNDPSNRSDEDAGEDGIPNTIAGMDGVMGTNDDDVLEDDGVWTTESYTPEMAAMGLIPPGKNVGDPIPGTGEDIDGDGVQDGPFQMSELNLPASLSSGVWGGNLPAGVTKMSDIATKYIKNLDCALYTNHALAGVLFAWGDTVKFNGCVVSRNESIIYGANELRINHDARLIGGGDNFGYYLPRTFKSVRIMKVKDNVGDVHWDQLTVEP